MTEEDEWKAIRRVLDGDPNAFGIFVDRYQNPILRMLTLLLNDQRRFAEDVAQDVFVEAYRRLPDFDPARSRFSTWLFMIARCRGLNTLRRKRPALFADPPEQPAEPVDPDGGESLAILDRAVQTLPPKQKSAFLLIVVEELSYAEAARVEGTTPGTIKSRVSRARALLKTMLEEATR
ncbi:MAG: sigma-70 family RNA polymerase sigma factor [Verrucomicrobiota bacterium]